MKAITYRSRLYAVPLSANIFGIAFDNRGQSIGTTQEFTGLSAGINARLACEAIMKEHAKAQGIVRAIHEME